MKTQPEAVHTAQTPTFLSCFKERKIAIIGYGNQGRAQALNMRDSGVTNLAIALRSNSPRRAMVNDEGLEVLTLKEATQWADILAILIPDEQQPSWYTHYVAPHIKPGSALVFAHGFAVHFGLITPPPNVDVLLVTPKGTGYGLRNAYENREPFPCLWGISQDYSGSGRDLALAYAQAAVGSNAYLLETTFREECIGNIFNEHALLGGLSGLIQAAFDTLSHAGVAPEIAYLETINGLKIMASLLHERGISGFNAAISNTAEYASYAGQHHLLTPHTHKTMAHLMQTIESGHFAQQWMDDYHRGLSGLQSKRDALNHHPIEQVGARVRRALLRTPSHTSEQSLS
jgi:ketol-acid reductoisomerase